MFYDNFQNIECLLNPNMNQFKFNNNSLNKSTTRPASNMNITESDEIFSKVIAKLKLSSDSYLELELEITHHRRNIFEYLKPMEYTLYELEPENKCIWGDKELTGLYRNIYFTFLLELFEKISARGDCHQLVSKPILDSFFYEKLAECSWYSKLC